ncbi:phosphotransferase [Brachybacterium sp. DNPG3]
MDSETSTPPPRPPTADLGVGRADVLRRLDRLVPEPGVDLSRLEIGVGEAPVGEGWDNLLWPVGMLRDGADDDGADDDGAGIGDARLVLRIARRALALPLLDRESVVLRLLRDHRGLLSMDVPQPLATADGAILMRWIPGATAADSVRGPARDLARMLAEVHSLPAPDLERSGARGVPLAMRAEAFAADLERTALPSTLRRRARESWDHGLHAGPWSGPDALLHGDPHPGNVILPVRGRPALIDWGDATVGDPASDLGALLLHAPSSAASSVVLAEHRRRAEELDGPLSALTEDAWDALGHRARAWRTRMALALLTAYPADHALGRIARRGLDGDA